MSKGFAGPAEYATEAELQRAADGLAAENARLREKVAALQNAIRQLVPGRPDETDEAEAP